MARTARKVSSTDIYHVTARGVGGQIIFENDNDRRFYLKHLQQAKDEYDIALYAWCLMGNHVHLLVQSSLEQLSIAMQKISSTYALYFNEQHNRPGHLFQGRYGSEPIEDESHLFASVVYIHNNPQRGGICNAEEYPWSSYHEYASGHGIADVEYLLDELGGKDAFAEQSREMGEGFSSPFNVRRRLSDDEAARKTISALNISSPTVIASMDRGQRTRALQTLQALGISVRQASRLTGVSRNVVGYAYNNSDKSSVPLS